MPHQPLTYDDVQDSPAGALLGCALTVHRMAEHVGRIYDVSAREVLAILEVAIGGPCSATELADRLYVSRGAMTGLVRRLTEQGWIETQPDPLDGRRLVIRATSRPRRLLHEWARRFTADITERVGVEQVEQLTADVTHCASELEDHRAILQRLGPIEVRQLMRTE